MGLFLSFVLLCLFVALLAGAAYAVYAIWYVGEERAKQQHNDASRQQKLLQEHNKRLSMMDANLSDSQRRALDDIQQREKLARRIEENESRIKRQAIAARLRNSAEEVRVRTQSVRLKNASAAADEKEEGAGEKTAEEGGSGGGGANNEDDTDDNARTVRLGNAPIRGKEGEKEEPSARKVAAQDALHVTDGDVTRYLPLVAGTVWSADGTVRLGGLAGAATDGADADDADGGASSRVGGGARVALGFDDAGRPRVEARDRLYAPHIATPSLSVAGERSVASFPGAKSEHNPNNWRTYLGKAGPDGNNYLRGDTRVTGNLKVEGDVAVPGVVGTTRLFVAPQGDNVANKGTIFGLDEDGDKPRNVVRGDTRFEGGSRIDVNGADVETRGGGRLRVRGGPADGALATLEAGFDGGARSALTFNGDSSPSSASDPAFDASKARWRVLADQGSGKDALRIDRTLAADHPDNDNDGGGSSTRWVPVSIEDGRIKLSGEVQACDRQGKNCRTL